MKTILLFALMAAGLILGLRATAERKKRLRETVLASREALSAVTELVRQRKDYQAESVLMNRGNKRSVARMTVVIIRGLLKSGEWK